MEKYLKVSIIVFICFFFLSVTSVHAAYYSLSYEAVGLDTWDTTTLVVNGDDTKATVTLPWSFEHFGTVYSTVYAYTNGLLTFVEIGELQSLDNSESGFRDTAMVAPLWEDLFTSVYKNEYSDRVVFTWDGYCYGTGGQPLTMQAVLYSNGNIRMRYDEIVTPASADPIVGVSAGDESNYLHSNWGNYSQTAYYSYIGAPPGTTTTTVAVGVAPTFSGFNASSATIKHSQFISFNVSIIDDSGVDPTSVILEVRSPSGDRYGSSKRPSLVSGDDKNGIYNANWTSPRNATNGNYSVYMMACDGGRNCPADYVNVGSFVVNGSLTFDGITYKSYYRQTDEIVLSGKLIDAFGSETPNANLTLTLASSITYNVKNQSDANGEFYIKQRTSLLDPLGTWFLTLSSIDEDGNEGELKVNFSLIRPIASLYYNVVFLSPTEDESYFRGESLRCSIKVLDLEEPVSNAEVILKTPSGERIQMSEVSAGTGMYRTNYRIGYDEPVGNWTVGIEALKQIDSELYGGSESISINIKPVNLLIDVLSPGGSRFTIGGKIKIKVKVEYPDNTPASGIVVDVTPTTESVVLHESAPGVYEGDYRFTDTGRFSLKVFALDPYDNMGFFERTISVVKPTVLDFAKQYWYVTLSIGLVLGYFILTLSLPRVMLKKYGVELNRQIKLKEGAQNKYFIDGSIDEMTFTNIMNRTDEKILELKGRVKKLKETKVSQIKLIRGLIKRQY